MRRLLVAIASVVLSLVMGVTFLTGCNLVTVDNERDMNQVVAVVKLEDAPEETIYKKDMVMAYLNYGYMYEQYYSYTQAQTFQLIIDNLVNNRVYVQYAMKEFNAKGLVVDNTITDVWDVSRYLTEIETNEVKYDAYKDMSELIDSYETETEEEKLGDTMIEAVRTIPTGATNDEEVSYTDKVNYITARDADKFGVAETEDRRKAFNEVINVLKVNDLLGDYKAEEGIVSTDYYKETLKGLQEQKLIEKYEKTITDAARAKITFDMLEKEYLEVYNKQKNWSATEFAAGIESASATSPIVYSGYNGYGLVYNVLIGADEETLAELDKWKENHPNYTEKDYVEARADIFSQNVMAKDLRSTWVRSGYDFEKKDDGYYFTGDYTLTSEENSLAFQGTVTELAPATDEEKAEYSVVAKPIKIRDFFVMIYEYIYGGSINGEDFKDGLLIQGKDVTEYDEKVKELMFAFSTDDSDTALNTYKGYSETPAPDGSDNEKYMQEFADAARRLFKDDVPRNSMIVAATDYGWHFMFLSETFDPATYNFATLSDYLDYEYGVKGRDGWVSYFETEVRAGWDDYKNTNHYLYVLLDNMASSAVDKALTNAKNKVISDYVQSGVAVTLYESRYADLING